MTESSRVKILLGSSSPRRRELLALLIPESRIVVTPPADANEAGFDDVHTLDGIFQRVLSIADTKRRSVFSEMQSARSDWSLIITADTVVIGTEGGQRAVLGKPDGPNWQATVRDWFQRYYLNQTHEVVTAVCLQHVDGRNVSFLERTIVRMKPGSEALLDWYLSTGEPLGKAGGYGLQGAGSLFVESLQGSSSNVIGLPLEPLWKILKDWQMLR